MDRLKLQLAGLMIRFNTYIIMMLFVFFIVVYIVAVVVFVVVLFLIKTQSLGTFPSVKC